MKIKFGDGKICVGVGLSNKIPSLILSEIIPQAIGSTVEQNGDELVKMVFTKEESIDVLINGLKRLKNHINGKQPFDHSKGKTELTWACVSK